MDKKQITLSQALDGYFIAARARRLSPHTLQDYDYTFRRFEAFLKDDPPLTSITVAEIRGFLNSMTGISNKTLLNYHTGLSALWTWATREGLVERNIVRDAIPPKPEQREIVPFTKTDVKAMLSACDRSQAYVRPGKRKCDHERPTALRDKAIVILLVDTGIRASELCNLRIEDLDQRNHNITVMGKGSKERVIPISSRTSQFLWRYLAMRDKTRPRDPLFVTNTGRPLDRNNLSRLVRLMGERAGVRGAHPHRFRHTFAITFLRNGGNVFALQKLLGHSTMDMVKRYLALAQVDLENAHREASPVSNWLL